MGAAALLAHEHDGGSAMLYGYMLGALGLGAILGSVLVRRVQAHWGASGLISAAAACWRPACWRWPDRHAVGRLPRPAAVRRLLDRRVATYNTTVQMLVPDWVKARSLALYQTAIFGGWRPARSWGHFAGTLGVARWPAPASCWA